MQKIILQRLSLALLTVWGFVGSLQAQCGIIYASPTGAALADGSEAAPVDLQTALSQACTQTRKHIRLLSGTYNLSAKMVVGCDDIIIDGDWEVVAGIGRKNSNLVTTININANLETAAYDGAAGTTVGYYIGVQAVGRSNLHIEDITFNVKNGGLAGTAVGTTGNRGNSVYGFYFRNCPNYFLERCVMNAGAASQGTLGVAGANGANGANGTNGTDGACNDDCSVNNSGRGGNGGGTGAGSGGATVVDASCGSTSALGDNGIAGAAAANARAGGGGGSGGTGGAENNRGGAGGNGGNGGGGAGATLGGAASTSGNGGTGGGNCTNINSQSAGAAGSAGTAGTSGSTLPISTTYSFFWLPSGQSTNGTDGTGGGGGKGGGGGGGQGCFFCTDGTGSAGGGGGGGGQGGAAGTGGWGSGGSFALYSFNSTGQRGTSTINAAAAVAGAAGGTGGTGGTGGIRGLAGGEQGGFLGCATCEVGLGSNGGNGGNGGNAGAGGNGAAGVSSTIELQSGGSSTVAPASAITQIFTNQPLQGCTNSEIIISKDAGTWNAATPFITDLNISSSSFNTASNTASISFATTGWKDLVGSSGTYRNFVYIGNNRPAPVFAASTPTVVCEGDVFPLSSPTAGADYEWIVFPAAGSTAAPTAVFTTSVAGWNTPVTGVSTNYRVRLRIRDNCCGWSSPVYFSFSVVGSATPPLASGTTICEGQTATLVATGSGSNNINWYSDALGQILLQSTAGVSSTFTTPSLNQNTVFFVGEGSSSCPGALRSVAVLVNPRPVAPIANPVTVCVGTPVVFASSNNGGTVRWFNAPIGGAALATGTTYNAGLLAAGSYTFYVEEFDGSCPSARVPVFATVNPSATPPTASGATICAGNTANLSAVGVGIRWYADAGLSNQIASGNNFTSSVLNTNTTFFVTSTSTLGCQSTGTPVVVTVNPLPTTPTVTNATICAGNTATLSATTAGGTINWFSDATAANQIATGTSFTTPVLTQSATYFVRETSAAGCFSAIAGATANVNPLPATPTASAANVCQGGDVVINASGIGTGDLVFYNASLVEIARVALPTGSHTVAGLANGNYTFYVRADDGTCLSGAVAVSASVFAAPAAPVSSSVTICQGNTATFTATGTNVRWYSDAALTNQVGNGNSFTSTALTASTSYFVTNTSANNCQSLATTVTATVNNNPAAPVVTNATICAGNTATLSATTAGGTINWFSDATAANQIATGTSFTTPVLTQSATYFVRETSAAGCFSAIAGATANVNPLPATPTASAANVCQGGDVVINASGIGTGDLVFYNASLVEIARVALPTGSHTVAGLANGNYTFYVRADDGTCLSGAVAVSASVFAAPAAPVSSSVTICQGNTATFTATGTNVRWYSDAALTNQVGNGNSFTSTALTASTSYFVTNTSANNCQSLATTVTATVNNNPAAPTTTGASTCQGGSATLTAVGAGGTLNWYSDASAINQVATGGSFAITTATQSTIYFVRETSVDGCNSQVSSVTLNVTGLPNAPSTLAISVCQGTSVTLSATGSGIGDIVFYDASNVEIGRGTMSMANRTITFSVGVLAVGNYVYTATEAVGTCESTPSAIQVEVRTLPAAPTATNDGPACVGEDIALQASTVFGGIYNWTGPNGFSQTGQTVFINSVTAAVAGTYQVNVILAGCTSTNASTTVVVNAAPVLAGIISNNSPLCANETLVLSVPTMAGVTFGWTGPNGFTSSGNTVTVATVTENDHQGFYTVVGVNAVGCSSNPLSTLVNVNAVPPATFALSNSPICESGTLELMVPVIFGATYTWTGPDSFVSADRQPLIDDATAAASGTYEVVINLGGCTSTLTTAVSVLSSPNATIINDTTISEEVPLQLYATGGVLYEWRGALQYLSDANSPTPIFSGAPAGVYTYYVNVTTVNGCVTQQKVDITVLPSSRPVFVDLFTPNGDGINDTWEIGYLANLTPYTLVVYSRGGFEVYRSDNYANNWDGTRDGNALPDGTYWYILTLGNGVEYRGAVTIRR